jgi:predicted transglutaminase-like cysteine proteinase
LFTGTDRTGIIPNTCGWGWGFYYVHPERFSGKPDYNKNTVKMLNIKKLLTIFRKLFPPYYESDNATMKRTLILGGIAVLLLFLICPVPVTAAAGTCTVSVTSLPDGATVFVDGIGYGKTPMAPAEIACGIRTVTVSHEGYADYTATIDFTTGIHKDLMANLVGKPDLGSIVIRSEPDAATVIVDDVPRGKTPLTVYSLEPGRHNVLLMADGYENLRDTLTVTPGAVPEYNEYLIPLPDTGFISIASEPGNASVQIDGNDIGFTPTRLRRLSDGEHTVTVYKPGYWNFTRNLTVSPGESRTAKAILTEIPETSVLYLESVPAGMNVNLNGTYKGVTPLTLYGTSPGDYRVEFRHPSGSPAVNGTFSFAAGGSYELVGILDAPGNFSIGYREWQYRNDSGLIVQDGWTNIGTEAVIQKNYSWIATGHKARATLVIPESLREYYRNQPHRVNQTNENIHSYAISDHDRPYLHDLIENLKDASESRTYSARNDYHNVVSFVQSLQYQDDVDPVTNQPTDYWKYPVETLADGGGDCEDSAILTAALLKEMGYDVAVVIYPVEGKGHAMAAVACDNCNGYYYPLDGKKYYTLETTGAGFSLGMLMKDYVTTEAVVLPL